MLESIFVDFCSLEDNSGVNLIEAIVVKHFVKDLTDLSKDKVVNVRISLAHSFYQLQKTLDRIEVEQLSSSNKDLQNQLNRKSKQIQKYLNLHFASAIRNLKNDPSECVSELLQNYNVFYQHYDNTDAMSSVSGSSVKIKENVVTRNPLEIKAYELFEENQKSTVMQEPRNNSTEDLSCDFDESKRTDSHLLDFSDLDNFRMKSDSIMSDRGEQMLLGEVTA